MTSRQFPVEDSLAVLIRECVVELLEHRTPDATICPSEAARILGGELNVEWRDFYALLEGLDLSTARWRTRLDGMPVNADV